MEISDKLKKRLKNEITETWWDSTGHTVFTDLAKQLITKGFTEEEAFDFLQIAYTTVSMEYGG